MVYYAKGKWPKGHILYRSVTTYYAATTSDVERKCNDIEKGYILYKKGKLQICYI